MHICTYEKLHLVIENVGGGGGLRWGNPSVFPFLHPPLPHNDFKDTHKVVGTNTEQGLIQRGGEPWDFPPLEQSFPPPMIFTYTY